MWVWFNKNSFMNKSYLTKSKLKSIKWIKNIFFFKSAKVKTENYHFLNSLILLVNSTNCFLYSFFFFTSFSILHQYSNS